MWLFILGVLVGVNLGIIVTTLLLATWPDDRQR